MSERDSRMPMASSAFTASMAVKPASSTISAARIRSTISSSTTSTFGTSVNPVEVGILLILRGNRKHRGLVVQPTPGPALKTAALITGKKRAKKGKPAKRLIPRRDHQLQERHSLQRQRISFAFLRGAQDGFGYRFDVR